MILISGFVDFTNKKVSLKSNNDELVDYVIIDTIDPDMSYKFKKDIRIIIIFQNDRFCNSFWMISDKEIINTDINIFGEINLFDLHRVIPNDKLIFNFENLNELLKIGIYDIEMIRHFHHMYDNINNMFIKINKPLDQKDIDLISSKEELIYLTIIVSDKYDFDKYPTLVIDGIKYINEIKFEGFVPSKIIIKNCYELSVIDFGNPIEGLFYQPEDQHKFDYRLINCPKIDKITTCNDKYIDYTIE